MRTGATIALGASLAGFAALVDLSFLPILDIESDGKLKEGGVLTRPNKRPWTKQRCFIKQPLLRSACSPPFPRIFSRKFYERNSNGGAMPLRAHYSPYFVISHRLPRSRRSQGCHFAPSSETQIFSFRWENGRRTVLKCDTSGLGSAHPH